MQHNQSTHKRRDIVFLWPTIASQRGTKTFESGLLSYRYFLPRGVYFNFEKVKIVLTPAQLIPNRVNIKNEKKLLLIIEVTKIWSSDQP